jgi:hypothetical protein
VTDPPVRQQDAVDHLKAINALRSLECPTLSAIAEDHILNVGYRNLFEDFEDS